jgi:hypothetical protein
VAHPPRRIKVGGGLEEADAGPGLVTAPAQAARRHSQALQS